MACSPSSDEIRAARQAAGLTQTQAAALVCTTLRNWQQWEGGERRMHPGLWKLFRSQAMSNFVRFMSPSHLNYCNVALYVTNKGAVLRAEQVPSDKALGVRKFASEADACAWYEKLPGSGVGKLSNAIAAIRHPDADLDELLDRSPT